jgi:hypothetical protein
VPRILSNNPLRRSNRWRLPVRITSQSRRSIRTLGKDDPNTVIGDRESLRGFATKATLTTAMAGADNDLLFTAKNADYLGNSVRVAFVNPGGTVGRTIVVAGNDITVNLAVTAGAINGTETATSIAAAINADVPASGLVTAAVKVGDTGAGVVAAFALTNLAGGAWTKSNERGDGRVSPIQRLLGRKEDRQTANGTGVEQIPNDGVNRSLRKR